MALQYTGIKTILMARKGCWRIYYGSTINPTTAIPYLPPHKTRYQLTFQSMQEIFYGMLIQVNSLLIFLSFVSLSSFLHKVNGFLHHETSHMTIIKLDPRQYPN